MDHHEHARRIAERVAAGLQGARGVALTGSVATGTDRPESDIDLIAVSETDADLEVRSVEGRMVTIGWKRADTINAAFQRPWEAPVAVPTWRAARILTDPDRTLAAVQDRARSWDWSRIAEAADRCAADGLVGLAEEAHKVAGMLAAGRDRPAAANRDILTLQLPGTIALADRILYISENDLWDLVCQAEGPAWTQAWDAAAGIGATGLADTCRAALRLYRLAADRLDGHLNDRQRAVVTDARRLTGT